MSALWVALLVVAVASPIAAQVPFVGSCPDLKPQANFNAADYLGKWYEAERYFAIFEFAGKCVTANYSLDKDGNVNVVNRQISSLTGVETSIEGTAKVLNASEPAKLSVRFPSLPWGIDAPYWVLETDYENYAVVWSCLNFSILSTRNAWILTRAREPSLAIMEKAYSVLDKNGISRAYFTRTDQKRCPANN